MPRSVYPWRERPVEEGRIRTQKEEGRGEKEDVKMTDFLDGHVN